MSLFGGLAGSKTGNTFNKPEYPKHGRYIFLVKETDIFRDKDGQGCTTAVGKLLHSEPLPLSPKCKLDDNFQRNDAGQPFINPVPAGLDMKFFWMLERSLKGELTYRGQYEMNRFKGFLCALLGGPDMGISDEQMTPAVAMAVMLGSSRLAQSGTDEDKASLVEKVNEDFEGEMPGKLINLAGQVLQVDVTYSEYKPSKGKNAGKLVSSTEVKFIALDKETQDKWIAASKQTA